jgi:hypothetical protein
MIPPEMTVAQLLGFLDLQVEATPENYRKYMEGRRTRYGTG